MYTDDRRKCILALFLLVFQFTFGQPPGCFYGGLLVQWCNFGLWQEWNCYTCATIQQATRQRELCCQDKQMSKQDCYNTCHLDISEGTNQNDCTVQCGISLKPCVFDATNETINLCDFSSWLAWDCAKCPDNWPGNTKKTDRKRAICCGEGWLNDVDSCLKLCGKNEHSDTDIDFCVNVCPLSLTSEHKMPTTQPTTKSSTTTSHTTQTLSTITTTSTATPTTASTSTATTALITNPTKTTPTLTKSSTTKLLTSTPTTTPTTPTTTSTEVSFRTSTTVATKKLQRISPTTTQSTSITKIPKMETDSTPKSAFPLASYIHNNFANTDTDVTAAQKQGDQVRMEDSALCKDVGVRLCFIGPWKLKGDPYNILNTCTLILLGVTTLLLIIIVALVLAVCHMRSAERKIQPLM